MRIIVNDEAKKRIRETARYIHKKFGKKARLDLVASRQAFLEIHIRLRQQSLRVRIEGHQVAHARLVGHIDAIVQGDEVVVVIILHHEVHKAVIDGDVPVDDFLAVRF